MHVGHTAARRISLPIWHERKCVCVNLAFTNKFKDAHKANTHNKSPNHLPVLSSPSASKAAAAAMALAALYFVSTHIQLTMRQYSNLVCLICCFFCFVFGRTNSLSWARSVLHAFCRCMFNNN